MIRTVIIPPAEEPLSLTAAKSFLQIGHDAEDDLIRSLLAGGRVHIENSLDMALVSQTLDVKLKSSEFGPNGYALKPSPVRNLISVIREGDDGSDEDVTTLFDLKDGNLFIRAGETLAELSSDCRLSVRFEAGFGAASDVPDDLKFALRLLLGQSYQHRDGAFATNALVTITDLLAPYREVRL